MEEFNLTNTTKNIGKELENLQTNVTNFLKNDTNYIYILLSLTIVFIILFLLLSWINYTLSLNQGACKRIENIYPNDNAYRTKTFINGRVNFENPNLNITVNNDNFPKNHLQKFKNYFVKSSYNSCCADGYKNNWVNECALEKCISQGARFLDFEIYSLNNQPIVAASTANNYNIKETYNFIYLSKIFEFLHNNAFNEEITQSYNDPMIIHLRLMTENTNIYDLIAGYIDTHLNKNNYYLLNKKNTIGHINYDPKDIIDAKLEIFAKKFIIIAYQSDSVLKSSNLKNYVNLRSGSNYCRLLRFQNIISSGDSSELLISESKNNYTIILPDINNSLDNYDFTLPLSNGCQVIAMKFQNMDSNLHAYNDYFSFHKGSGYNFVLKPNNLLYNVEDNISVPEPEVNLESPGIPGTILIYNKTEYEIIEYKLFKTQNTTRQPARTGYINKKEPNNNNLEKINLDSNIASNSYYIEFYSYGTSNNKLSNLDIEILALGTENSATKGLFNNYPLETTNPEKNLFKITPYTRKSIADIKLEVNSK